MSITIDVEEFKRKHPKQMLTTHYSVLLAQEADGKSLETMRDRISSLILAYGSDARYSFSYGDSVYEEIITYTEETDAQYERRIQQLILNEKYNAEAKLKKDRALYEQLKKQFEGE